MDQLNDETTFTIKGTTFTYNKQTGIIKISSTDMWNKVCTGIYDIQKAENPEIAITNTYTPKTTDVTIGKLVKGNMGDVNKGFSFEMTVTNAPEKFAPSNPTSGAYTVSKDDLNNYVYSFTLKNNGKITIPDLPLGATIQIKETNADGYEKAAIVKTALDAESGQSIDMGSIPVTSDLAGKVITIVNTKEVDIDTGISLTSLPYILVLITAAAGMLAIVLRRRHSNN